MICDICGHEIADDATFCFYCGNPINGLGVPDEPQDVTAKQDHGSAHGATPRAVTQPPAANSSRDNSTLQPATVVAMQPNPGEVPPSRPDVSGAGDKVAKGKLPVPVPVLAVFAVAAVLFGAGVGLFGLFGGFCGRDSGIGPAQRAKTTIWN